MAADDPKILANLKRLIAKGMHNPWEKVPLHVNSTYNDLVFSYWYYYDDYSKNALKPNKLTSIEPITRAIRLLAGREKNIKMQTRIAKYYAK